MTISVRVPVSPEVLRWAQIRSGKDVENRFPHWRSWLDGDTAPTLRQLEDVAKYTHVPFGTLLLDEPPSVALPIPDYRRSATAHGREPSPDLLAVLHQSQRRQAWFREYAIENALDAHTVPHLDAGTTVSEAAATFRSMFQLDAVQTTATTRHAFRAHLRETFEDLGGLVVFTSMVANDTHRLLDRDEFRGFTLVDDVAPLIFVNTNDSLAGQAFTFFHELAHLARRDGGLDDEATEDALAEPRSGGDLETWCDLVAAETLAPTATLRQAFNARLPLTEQLDQLARRLHVSTLVILLQLRRAGLVAREGFDETYEAEVERVAGFVDAREPSSGGDFYLLQPYRIGVRLATAIIRDTETGRTSYPEALSLLSLSSTTKMDALAAHLASR